MCGCGCAPLRGRQIYYNLIPYSLSLVPSKVMTLLALRNLPSTADVFTGRDFYSIDEADAQGQPPRKAARMDSSDDISASRREFMELDEDEDDEDEDDEDDDDDESEDEDEDAPCRNIRVLNLQGITDICARCDKGDLTILFIAAEYPIKEPLIEMMMQTIEVVLSSDKNARLLSTYEEAQEACASLILPYCQQGTVLREKVQKALMKLAREFYGELMPRSNGNTGIRWLNEFVEAWEWYYSRILLLRAILLDLDRVYILENKLDSILQEGLAAWKEHVQEKGDIDSLMVQAIEEWIRLERVNGTNDASRTDIKRLINALQTLNSFDNFQVALLSETSDFYVKEAADRKTRMNPVDFLVFAEARVNEEVTRCRDILPQAARSDIISYTEKSLWGSESQVTWIAEDALPQLLAKKDVGGIVRMHQLFSRVEALKSMHTNFKKFAASMVLAIVQRPEGGDENMVQLLLDVKKFMDDVVERLGDKNLGYASTAAFETGFASRPRKPAELIAKFIDMRMRTGQKSSSDDEHMAFLKTVLELYRFTPGQLYIWTILYLMHDNFRQGCFPDLLL